ncbi:MAG: rRNA pseudouridine synthase [Acidobacteria bacterium]|nr:MAG: rRNA pseudouridine synthase [Acidobacteriota bacterium]
MIRLNKIISQAGLASRRLADQLIAQGRVQVNGHVVSELGAKADPSRDHIKVDGRRLKIEEHKRYFLLYKPRGVVSTRADDKNRATVIDLLSKQGIRGYYYPVGRLDYDSEGLLLLTNDGEFAEIVTHPRHELTRTYEARVLGVPDDHELDRLRKGLVVDGERTLPAGVKIRRILKGNRGPEALVEIAIREGRNRQVRNMCDAIGHPVVQLTRTKIGPLTAEGLRPGHVRELRPDEIKALTKRSASPPKTASDATPRRTAGPRPRRSREK